MYYFVYGGTQIGFCDIPGFMFAACFMCFRICSAEIVVACDLSIDIGMALVVQFLDYQFNIVTTVLSTPSL